MEIKKWRLYIANLNPRLGTKTRDFVEVIDRVKPSVVQVRVEKTFIHPKKPGAPEGEIPVKITGSGLVIREESYILTCAHVLEQAKGKEKLSP
jgi:S1-C subfamily serine protease